MEQYPKDSMQSRLERHYEQDDDQAWKVRARFEVYQFAVPPVDFEALAVQALKLEGATKDIIDIGTADGSFLYRLWWEHNTRGQFVGVEPNASQFARYDLTIDELRILHHHLEEKYPGQNGSLDELEKSNRVPRIYPNISLVKNWAHDLAQVPSESADIVSAMFMLYHLTDEQRQLAFQEFKRVMRPNGVFMLATSGNDNKSLHRKLENLIAAELGTHTVSPPPMNTGFTTERAEQEILTHFRYASIYKQQSSILIADPKSIEVYKRSQLSLRDLYHPEPDLALFTFVLESVFDRALVNYDNNLIDQVSRSMIIASDEPLDDDHLRSCGFVPLFI